MDRILPLPQHTREALIDRYFPKNLRQQAKASVENRACIVRPYFGMVKPTDTIPDNLWYFPMYADEMDKLRLDTQDLVREMAMGLAIIQWEACIYGDDIEFVLGTARAERPNRPTTFEDEPPRNVHMYDLTNRPTHLWMFDFDKTDIFSMDMDPNALIQRLVTAVTGNDPYFPTPRINRDLFDSFCATYIQASKIIMRRKLADGVITEAHTKLSLPERFVAAWSHHIENDREPDILFEGDDGDDQGWGEDEIDSDDEDEDDDDDEDEGQYSDDED